MQQKNTILQLFNHSMTYLSIIVPVYNVEKYVRTCIESIYRQGLDENRFELIIINDGTKDKSMEVIADIIQQHSNIIVIEQENQGVSVARNRGIECARGEFLLIIDSDDLLIDYSIKPLLEKAITLKPDLIVADFIQMNDKEIEEFLDTPPNLEESFDISEISGYDLVDPAYCKFQWRILFRKDFLINNHISFIPGILAQDVPFVNECYLKAKNCFKTTRIFIIYRRGHHSVSELYRLRNANDVSITMKEAWKLSELPGLSTQTIYKQQEFLFIFFYSHICAITYGHLKNMTEVIMAFNFLKKQIPTISFKHNNKQKLWTLLYNNIPTPIFASIIYFKQTMLKKISNIKFMMQVECIYLLSSPLY